jgi:hypothetical protein
MKLSELLIVSPIAADSLSRACAGQTTFTDEVLFDQEVVFADGNRMAVQVVGSTDAAAWAQGVLYSPAGAELATSEVYDSFLGEYVVGYGDNEYACRVSPPRLTATYRAQHWVNDGDVLEELWQAEFDATLCACRLTHEELVAFKPNTYDSDDFEAGCERAESHDGPFEVDVDLPAWLNKYGFELETITSVEWDRIRGRFGHECHALADTALLCLSKKDCSVIRAALSYAAANWADLDDALPKARVSPARLATLLKIFEDAAKPN